MSVVAKKESYVPIGPDYSQGQGACKESPTQLCLQTNDHESTNMNSNPAPELHPVELDEVQTNGVKTDVNDDQLISGDGNTSLLDTSKGYEGRCKKVGQYLLGCTIGEGSYGKVRLATHLITKQRVSIWVMSCLCITLMVNIIDKSL